jgi:hypothetical protein
VARHAARRLPAGTEEATRRALAHGNRLVRDGDLEAAVSAYALGWDEVAAGGTGADLAGVLAYNLGTTLHRLERRPEALLWYRRALPLRPGDRWLADNLALVRGELAAPRPPPPGLAARLVAWHRPLGAGAVAAAWGALALLALRRPIGRGPRWASLAASGAAIALGVLSLLLWVTPTAAALAAPRPAVLLAACPAAAESGDAPAPEEAGTAGAGTTAATAPLPPGSEVWVRPDAGGGWRIAGGPEPVCPAEAVGLVAAPVAAPVAVPPSAAETASPGTT